jgi:hypothetical protein
MKLWKILLTIFLLLLATAAIASGVYWWKEREKERFDNEFYGHKSFRTE